MVCGKDSIPLHLNYFLYFSEKGNDYSEDMEEGKSLNFNNSLLIINFSSKIHFIPL